jgi:hypothetical protein
MGRFTVSKSQHTLDEIEKVKGIAKLTIHDERPDKH